MNNDWTSLLENNGATFSENGDTEFHNNSEASCQKINLSHLGVIRITGEDRETFLQGQLTNDTRNIAEDKSQLSSYCTPKGRMLANFRILQHDSAWFMLIPAERLDAILKRLTMFVLRSKVSIENVSNDFIVTGLVGNCIADQLDSDLPADTDDVTNHDGLAFVRVEKNLPRFIVIGEVDAMKNIWNKLDKAIPVNTSQWRLHDIQAGIPTVYEETVEAFIPQMTNMHLLNGVSFTKGCYTGQEVVARMQYLGKLKRRMYPVNFETSLIPKPGDDIYSDSSQSGQGAGKLVDVVSTGENRYEGLAVLEINNIGDGKLQLTDSNGPVIHVTAPPYEFESEENK